MTNGRTPSIRTSIHVAFLLTALTSLIAAGALHRQGIHEEHERVQDAGAVMITQIAAAQLRADAIESPRKLSASCVRLIEHPDILGACFWDASGRAVCGEAVTPGLRRWMALQAPSSGPEPASKWVQLPSESAPGYSAARWVDADIGAPSGPAQAARMTLLLVPDAPAPPPSALMASFFGPLVFVAAGGVVFGSWSMRRQLVGPLLALVRSCSTSDHNAPPASELDWREDELGMISRSLSSLREELDEWRERAELIERRMDTQIAAKTQEIMRDLKRIQREVWRDSLTGVNNRRMFDENFGDIFAAQRDARQDLSVVMLDLDHFKIVNDVLGHTTGDALLRFVGELLQQCLRSDDVAVRYGGDEFLLVLPGVEARGAQELSNRIIAMFCQRARLIANVEPSPSISAGIASIRGNHASTPDRLIKLADAALYKAKEKGRKQAVVAGSV